MICCRATVVPVLIGVIPILGAACAPGPREATGETTRTISQPIIGGIESTEGQDAVVLVVHPFASGYEICTGTLLAPRLVLTARHCLARASSTVECAANGEPIQGVVSKDFAADSLLVFGGRERPDRGDTTAVPSSGAKIIDDGASTLCNHDIGLVVLDVPVAGATIAPIRLDLPATGEEVTLVGWGISDDSTLPEVRRQRAGVRVIGVGRSAGLGSSEFTIAEGPCEGDSGGPALAASGAVIGLSSRGSNGTNSSGAAACRDGMNIYTSPAGFRDLVLGAYAEAGQAPWLEGEPNPLLARAGEACGADGECQSNDCAPDSHTCASPLQSAPAEPTSKDEGCGIAARPSRSAGAGSALVLAVAAGLVARARARSRRAPVREGVPRCYHEVRPWKQRPQH